MPTTGCKVQGCLDEHMAKGYCKRHYYQLRRTGRVRLGSDREEYANEVGTCAARDCSNQFRQRAVGAARKFCCRNCRDRQGKAVARASGDYVPFYLKPGAKPCTVDGCDKPLIARGYCPMHLERVKKYGTPGEAGRRWAAPGESEWKATDEGYLRRSRNGRVELQHRVVMEDHLGRSLYPDETVHHRNGVRDDNRAENLELWSSWQPAGQRVEDKVAWARELLARYGDGESAR